MDGRMIFGEEKQVSGAWWLIKHPNPVSFQTRFLRLPSNGSQLLCMVVLDISQGL